jgi:GDPmannose 4,6-dehydratase
MYEIKDAAFRHVGVNWQNHCRHDPRFDRPTEISNLVGEASKASQKFGWSPQIDFESLIGLMVDSDICAFRANSLLASG